MSSGRSRFALKTKLFFFLSSAQYVRAAAPFSDSCVITGGRFASSARFSFLLLDSTPFALCIPLVTRDTACVVADCKTTDVRVARFKLPEEPAHRFEDSVASDDPRLKEK